MDAINIILIGVFLFSMIRGWRKGALKMIYDVLALIFLYICASQMHKLIWQNLLQGKTNEVVSILASFVISLIVIWVVGIIVKAIHKIPIIHGISSLIGAIAGIVVAVLIIWIILFLLHFLFSIGILTDLMSVIQDNVVLSYLYSTDVLFSIFK